MTIDELFYGIDFSDKFETIIRKSPIKYDVTNRLDPTVNLITRTIEFEPENRNYLGFNLEKLIFQCENKLFSNLEVNAIYLYLFPNQNDYETLKEKLEFIFISNGGTPIYENNEFIWIEISLSETNKIIFTPYDQHDQILLNWTLKVW